MTPHFSILETFLDLDLIVLGVSFLFQVSGQRSTAMADLEHLRQQMLGITANMANLRPENVGLRKFSSWRLAGLQHHQAWVSVLSGWSHGPGCDTCFGPVKLSEERFSAGAVEQLYRLNQ